MRVLGNIKSVLFSWGLPTGFEENTWWLQHEFRFTLDMVCKGPSTKRLVLVP